MNQLAVTLADLALTLKNDGPFFKSYREASDLAEDRREAIRTGLTTQDLRTRCIKVDAAMREQLRRYLDDIWNMVPARHALDSALMRARTLEFWKDTVQYPEKYASAKKAAPAKTNYRDLPDGTILVTVIGERYIKGAHPGPGCSYMRPSPEQPLIGHAERNKNDLTPGWCAWDADGQIGTDDCSGGDFDLVSYELVDRAPQADQFTPEQFFYELLNEDRRSTYD